MVSIIAAVFNVESYIERCIKSVLTQSYSNLEFIIVDDGSYDSTGRICQEYAKKDSRIIYIKKKNEGQGKARNTGLKAAMGDYVTYVDGDDWLEGGAVEKMYDTAVEENADVIVGDIWYVYEKQGKLCKKYSKIRYENLQIIRNGQCPEKISRLRTFTWGKLYRRSFLLRENFIQPALAYEDVATIPLLLLHADTIVYIHIPVYNYLKSRNTSTIYDSSKVGDLLLVLQQLHHKLRKEIFYDSCRPEIRRLFWGQIRSLCIAHKVSWKELRRKESDFLALVQFMKETFPEFDFLDDYAICVFNSKVTELALRNLVVEFDSIGSERDMDNKKGRILLKKGILTKEYEIEDQYTNVEIFDEDQLWNYTDHLFCLLIGED